MDPETCPDCGGDGAEECPNPGCPDDVCPDDCSAGYVECGNCGGTGYDPGGL